MCIVYKAFDIKRNPSEAVILIVAPTVLFRFITQILFSFSILKRTSSTEEKLLYVFFLHYKCSKFPIPSGLHVRAMNTPLNPTFI